MELEKERKIFEALKVLLENGEAGLVFLMFYPQSSALNFCQQIFQLSGGKKLQTGGNNQSTKTSVLHKSLSDTSSEPFLYIDHRHPGTIKLNGKILKLTSKQFRLLLALAEHPGMCVSYDEIYDKVWGNEVAVEIQQIAYHKSQLIKKFSTVIPKAKSKALITTIAGEGLVLNLRKENLLKFKNF
jgi:DNA-binding winged helix-turn-helix (wHTH) protein